jgi:competence protein ComGC
MAKPRTRTGASGFSLVEMLVALVFTMVMMAGMATVFKASLSTLYTSGEAISSVLRNRMSLDQLGNDINTAEMYLTNLTAAPVTQTYCPPIFILPNMKVVQVDGSTSTPASTLDPSYSDQLAFFADIPLPFEGKVYSGTSSPNSANNLVENNAAPDTATDFTYYVDCLTAPYANSVKPGQNFIFKDNFEVGYIGSVSQYNTTVVKVLEAASGTAGITGQSNGSGLPLKFQHVPGAGVVFLQPAQIVLYQVKMLALDPNRPAGVPCLVRDQYNYSDVVAASSSATGPSFTGLNVTVPEQIITENVHSFKAYLSCNSGQGWAGLGFANTVTGWAGWSTGATGIRALLDAQLLSGGRAGFATTEGNEQWFRFIPTLVRCDITTRTAAQRTEYYKANDPNNPNNISNPFKNLTQTLVFMPRESGLPMD